MKQVESCYAAGELAIKIDIIDIQNVASTDHRSNSQCAFVDCVQHRVRVTVDDAGHDILTSRIDDSRIRRGIQVFSHRRNLAIPQ